MILKKIVFVFVFLAIVTGPFVNQVFGASDKVSHPFKEKRELEQLDQDSAHIEIHQSFPQKPYEVLEEINGTALASQNNERVYKVLKRKAFKLQADAVVGVNCEKYGVGVSCHGSAVRWK